MTSKKKRERYPGRPPRLSAVFNRTPLYFVTFNTWNRQPILATDSVHEAFRSYVHKNQSRGFAVGRYVIMPDHVHLFVRVGFEQKLTQYIRLMKQVLTKRIRQVQMEGRIWQPGFFDHILRNSESYAEKGSYVQMNPVRAGLAEQANEWIFAGEMEEIYFD
jgi:putative transposase